MIEKGRIGVFVEYGIGFNGIAPVDGYASLTFLSSMSWSFHLVVHVCRLAGMLVK